MTINLDHVRTWVAALRDPEAKQATGRLAKFIDDEGTVGYCCLGLGSKIAGIKECAFNEDDADLSELEDEPAFEYGEDHSTELAPVEFKAWLGYEVTPDEESGDVYLNCGVTMQGKVSDGETVDGVWAPIDPPVIERLSLAELNDDGWTFAQIADCINYFGLEE